MTKNQSSQKFLSLDSLRGLCAVIVAFYHVSWNFYSYDNGIIRNGYILVDFFFVLSGFVIYHGYQNRISNISDLKKFTILRIGRIYPLHLAFLFVFLLIEVAKYIAQIKFSIHSEGNEPFTRNNIYTFASNLFLTHSLGLHPTTSFNGPSWSISVEFYTYFIFAAAIYFFKNKIPDILLYLFFVIISLYGIIYVGHTSLNFDVNYGILRCIFGFFLGCLAYNLYNHLKLKNKNEAKIGVQNTVVFSSIVFTILFLYFKEEGVTDFFLPPIVAMLIIVLSLYNKSTVSRALEMKPLLWLGALSYSIYMTHNAVQWVFAQTLRVVFKIPTAINPASGLPTLQVDEFSGQILAEIYIIFVLTLSWITYTYIEEPWRKRSKQIAAKG